LRFIAVCARRLRGPKLDELDQVSTPDHLRHRGPFVAAVEIIAAREHIRLGTPISVRRRVGAPRIGLMNARIRRGARLHQAIEHLGALVELLAHVHVLLGHGEPTDPKGTAPRQPRDGPPAAMRASIPAWPKSRRNTSTTALSRRRISRGAVVSVPAVGRLGASLPAA